MSTTNTPAAATRIVLFSDDSRAGICIFYDEAGHVFHVISVGRTSGGWATTHECVDRFERQSCYDVRRTRDGAATMAAQILDGLCRA